ncbi:DUF485 domain-containing protein [Bacillus sp. SJS]|uniref:DUF485 domain-containing protein n=1 Tax=Bacillus sp. SJS TaxID=1423321 RepID=UPI0004DD2603
MDIKEEAQVQAERNKGARIDYTAIAESPAFQNLLAKKKHFILPLSLFFLAFYFTLPVLTAYTKVLNNPAIGAISWAWVFAFAQFIMTWVLCSLYSKKAASFDEMVEEIRAEAKQ